MNEAVQKQLKNVTAELEAVTKRVEKLEVYQGEIVEALRYTQGVVEVIRRDLGYH